MKYFLAVFAAVSLPCFAQKVLVQPYIQPGNGAALDGADVKEIIWVTEQKEGEFTLEHKIGSGVFQKVAFSKIALDFDSPPPPASKAPEVDDHGHEIKKPVAQEPPQHYFKYSATLERLPFNSQCTYRLKQGDKIVREEAFRTRVTADRPVRFVAVGDLANGQKNQAMVAWQIDRVQPSFLLALGDIVYSQGRVSEYMNHYWRTYNNVTEAGEKTGAPLMAQIPFYAVVGNHDTAMTYLDAKPDAFGVYYFFSSPLNGPGEGLWTRLLTKDEKRVATFRKAAGTAFPGLNYYSFDYGAAHFVVVDSNEYTATTIQEISEWVKKDLNASRQPWKFVCGHHPAFQSSDNHYEQQHMRQMQGVFEECGVTAYLAGHVHNYQRSKPIRFQQSKVKKGGGRVDGTFQLDETFDGDKDTTPEGVIHIVSGGGGANLYQMKLPQLQAKEKGKNNFAPYLVKHDAEQHSFTVVDVSPKECVIRQISLHGEEFDKIRITKP